MFTSERRFVAMLQAGAALLGAIQAFMWRNMMDADGMSYVDVAYTYLRGDWQWAINAYWSPLYSWIVAAALAAVSPTPAAEFPLIQTIDFLGFLLSLAGFSFFVRALFARYSNDVLSPGHRRAWLALAYAAFTYASIALQDVGRGGPDFLLAACFYVAAGIVLRLGDRIDTPLVMMAGLGFALGAGYLAKAIMFPVSLVFLAVIVLLMRKRPRGWFGVVVCTAAFASLAAPWMTVLSTAKGRLTYSDTGKLAYAWYVVDAAIMHAQESPVHGKPSHPTRRLSSGPVVHEFATPVPGTYPVWYDPSYWHDGIVVDFNPRLQLRRLAMSIQDLQSQGWFYPTVVTLLALCLLAGSVATRRVVASTWFVLIPVVAGFGLYALVLILTRHVAMFFVVGLSVSAVALGAAMKSADLRKGSAHLATGLSVVFLIMAVSQIIFVDRRFPEGADLAIAAELQSHGVSPGSRVGVIGDSMHSYWAHLGRMRIVAEIMPEQTVWFWAQEPAKRAAQLELFRLASATAVIADHVPSWADKAGWIPIDNGTHWAWISKEP